MNKWAISWGRDLALYAATVFLAESLQWQAHDLLWSFWLASLVIGYSMIVMGCLVAGHNTANKPDNAAANPTAVSQPKGFALSRLLPSLFMLAFFTVHFGLFHLVHALFLNGFFPVPNASVADVSLSPLAMLSLLPGLFQLYWPFLVIAGLREIDSFLAIRQTGLDVRTPYSNVIRMHVTIMAIAFATTFGIGHSGLYVLLVLYFLPLLDFVRSLWGELRQR